MKKIISTDSIGWLGRGEQFIELYGDYFKQGIFDGVEVIAVKPLSRLKKIIRVLEKHGIKTLSLHGRTGGENLLPPFYHLMMLAVNKMLINAKDTLVNFSGKSILFHTPFSTLSEVEELIKKYPPQKLILENHRIGKQGIKDTKEKVDYYRGLGINTSGLIDIYHYIYGQSTDYLKKNWRKIVDEIESFFRMKDSKGRKIFDAVHFPIGTRISDSLPIDEISDEMLKYFAQRINPHLDRFVIENQVKNLGLIYSTKTMMKNTKERNKRNIDRLLKVGLL